ncbi:protein Niban-like [Scleropages formosus]|uniref:Protein Niban-like n=1 Tax=Scleropages formosus TaxID=113540 RepID=A0A0P7XIH3_SCLFO|nr:protein Niban-like [Scleropages formosus]
MPTRGGFSVQILKPEPWKEHSSRGREERSSAAMGLSSSSLLDESKSSHIRASCTTGNLWIPARSWRRLPHNKALAQTGYPHRSGELLHNVEVFEEGDDQADEELRNFSPHYKRQYSVAFFSQLYDEVEQHNASQTQLLQQRDHLKIGEILYGENIMHLDDTRKWKERFVVVRADYSLECHDSYESFTKGLPSRQRVLPTGGIVLTSEEKYMEAVDRCFPRPNGVKEKSAPPMVVMPGEFPVYVSLPYRRDSYFCFHREEYRSTFISVLMDCIRHQNHDFEKKATPDVQAFLKAVQFYREEKGHYESWDMLNGSDVSVLANLVMEELLPSLETDLLPRLKGKEADRRRTWFATVEAAYLLVQEQLLKGFTALKGECQAVAKQQETLIRSHMDQIVSSRAFLEGKLKATVMEPAVRYCSENVQPFLASILEEIMGPVSSGFQEVRLLLENQMDQLCQDFQAQHSAEELEQALERLRKADLQGCYQHVESLQEPLLVLRDRFRFSRSDCLVQSAQLDMQQLMQNAVYTFELLLNTALKDHPAEPGLAMEKAKRRVLKQYDYDSSTVRKRIFRDALVDITLSAIKENLAPTCKPELHTFEQYIFADYADFIQVENVYEDILLQILDSEINKVVKEAATLKKHNLFMDSADPHFISQSSLGDSWTPPKSSPASSARAPIANTLPDHPPLGNGLSDTPGKESPRKSEQDQMDKPEILSSTKLVKDIQTLNGTEDMEVDKPNSAQITKVKAEDKLSSTRFDKHEINVQISSTGAAKDPLGDMPQSVKMVVNEIPSVLLKEKMKTDDKPSSDQTAEEEMNEMSSTVQIEEIVIDSMSCSNQPEDVGKTDADEKGIIVHAIEESTMPCVVFKDPKEAVAVRCVPSVGFTESVADGNIAGPAAEGTKSNTLLSSDLAAHLSESITFAQHSSSSSEETESQVCQQVESHVEAESMEEFTQSLQSVAPMEEHSPSLHVDILGMEPEKVPIFDCAKEIQDLPVKVIEVEDLAQQYPGESNA